MIRLDQKHDTAIRTHGKRDYPHECCGLLIGTFHKAGFKVVAEVYAISNAREEEHKRNRFLIRPEELVHGESYARKQNLDVVGFYHSHPDAEARPSRYDLEHAWPTYSYVIVSVREGHARELYSWEMKTDRSQFNQEEILPGVKTCR
jgi:proteasome lid subunit RPN8/RPN11